MNITCIWKFYKNKIFIRSIGGNLNFVVNINYFYVCGEHIE